MTDPATLLAIAERCEQAAGPDRELDAEIEAYLTSRVTHPRAPGYTLEKQDAEWKLARLAESGFISSARRPAPPYTASLDAAVTLVPVELPRNLRPGKWWWMLETWPDECRASVHYENGDPAILEESAKAATPALALCAAALRARAANQ
jgi:hypothetical protein